MQKNNNNNLHMDRQCKKNNKQFTYGQTVQKKLHWSIYSAPDSAKKQQQQFAYGQTVQKNNKQFTYGQTVQKNNKQFTYGQTVQKNNKQFTYGQYIFTDCTEDNVQNTHTYTQYT